MARLHRILAAGIASTLLAAAAQAVPIGAGDPDPTAATVSTPLPTDAPANPLRYVRRPASGLPPATAVPEPGGFVVFGTGLVLLAAARRTRRRDRA